MKRKNLQQSVSYYIQEKISSANRQSRIYKSVDNDHQYCVVTYSEQNQKNVLITKFYYRIDIDDSNCVGQVFALIEMKLAKDSELLCCRKLLKNTRRFVQIRKKDRKVFQLFLQSKNTCRIIGLKRGSRQANDVCFVFNPFKSGAQNQIAC